jgi:CHAD domain-containing protein
LDVLGANLETYCARVPAQGRAHLEALASAWRTERATHHDKLVALFDSAAVATWKERMDALLDDESADSTPDVAQVVPALLWKQYGTVRAYQQFFSSATLEQLHALRIDIKRLRYSLEFFRSDLANGLRLPLEQGENQITANLIQPLVALQDTLGEIQDAVVAGEALTDYIAAQAEQAKSAAAPAPDFRPIASYHAHLQSQIALLRVGLAKPWSAILEADYRSRLARAVAAI